MRRAALAIAVLLFACGETAEVGPDSEGPGMIPAPDSGLDAAASALDASSANDDAAAMAPDREPPNPRRDGNELRDTDCDGLSDAEEFGNVWASGGHTDPADADSDGDGLPDGLEVGRTTSVDPACAFTADSDPQTRTDPTNPDTDGDGLPDGAEDTSHDGFYDATRETSPLDPDSDGDGLCDGPRDVQGACRGGDPDPIAGGADGDMDGVPDAIDPDPRNPDTDGDGLCDGPLSVAGRCTAGEDLDADGARDANETDPRRVDTDCDGLADGDTVGGRRGEREAMTSPVEPDTDGDGLPDGLEVGVTTPADPSCAGFVPDRDPASTTDPRRADTDGDGIPDGAEDSNHDGRVDTGELNPRDAADGMSDRTASVACGIRGYRPIDRVRAFQPDLQLITANVPPNTFAERTEVTQRGRVVGLMGYNAGVQVAYLVVTSTPASSSTTTDAVSEERAVRTLLERGGRITNPITRSFRTWDGYRAVQASYAQAGTRGVKAQANAIAAALVPGASALLSTMNDTPARGGYRVTAEVVHRSRSTRVVLVAIAPAMGMLEQTEIVLQDLAGGSALGQFHDAQGIQCDRFASQGFAPLDILWAVDNSASMAQEQAQVAASANALGARLARATVDWRVAVVTSGFWQPGNGAGCTNRACNDTLQSQCRAFTRDTARFSRWFSQGNTAWIGAGGACNQAREEILQGARLILSPMNMNGPVSFVPPTTSTAALKIRANTNLVLILLGDADDQFYTDAQAANGILEYERFLRALPVASISIGGIVCPQGGSCGETLRSPRVDLGVINRLGGVVGSLLDLSSIAPTIDAIIDAAVGTASPYTLSRDAIASTIKVAIARNTTVGACTWDDVPRSRTNGFDYDPLSKTIAFFGDCRPRGDAAGARISVSYRYWVDQSPGTDAPTCQTCGTCAGLSRCDLASCTCTCDQAVTCNPGFRWDASACDCVCDQASLSCGPTYEPDPSLCACVCARDCGGCQDGFRCQTSLCACEQIGI